MKLAIALVVAQSGCLSEPTFTCAVVPAPSNSGGAFGSAGGNPLPPVSCPQGKLVVGLGARVTTSPPMNLVENVVAGLTLTCATAVDINFAVTMIDRETVDVGVGTSSFVGPTIYAECPAGETMVGLVGHFVDATQDRFNSLALHCTQFDPVGALLRTDEVVAIEGTGTALRETATTCAMGMALTGVLPYFGGELDELKLRCSATTCP